MRWAAGLALLLATSAAAAPPLHSGYDDAGPDTRAMQDDDTANPGFLWVQQGEALWTARGGSSGRSCADCHGVAETAMRGVSARYPAYDQGLQRVVTLEEKINQSRSENQGAAPFRAESPELLALTAYIGLQSRGLPVAVDIDGPARATYEWGRSLYTIRLGQLHLACSQCHDDLAGHHLAGSLIPQGHANGYPLYRLEWQTLGSLTRRIRNCLTGVRAEPFEPGAPELVALELFLAARAKGLKVETPAVRP